MIQKHCTILMYSISNHRVALHTHCPIGPFFFNLNYLHVQAMNIHLVLTNPQRNTITSTPLHTLDYTNLVTLVTGATSGIGEAAAKAYAAAGAKVVVSGRRAEKGQSVVDAIIAAGGTATFIQADTSDEEQVKALVAKTVETYGGLHVAFNNAGVEGDVMIPSTEQTRENFSQVMDINVWGVLASMKHEIPAIIASGGGSVVNNASVAGIVGFNAMSTYSASKHAVAGLSKVAALEFAQAGVRVNAIAPGPIETEMYDRFATDEIKEMIQAIVPMGRAGSTDEIASGVLWLSHPSNSYTTGQVVAVDGGFITQ